MSSNDEIARVLARGIAEAMRDRGVARALLEQPALLSGISVADRNRAAEAATRTTEAALLPDCLEGVVALKRAGFTITRAKP